MIGTFLQCFDDWCVAIDGVDKKLADRRTALGKVGEMSQRLANLRKQAVSVEVWKKELTAFAAACPDARQTPDFTRAAALIDSSLNYSNII